MTMTEYRLGGDCYLIEDFDSIGLEMQWGFMKITRGINNEEKMHVFTLSHRFCHIIHWM